MRIPTTRTGRPTIRARTRRGSAGKRLRHRHRRLSHRRGFPSHRARRRPRGDGVEHELARRLAAAGLSALAAFRRFCRVAASLDQSGPAERCGRGLHLLELGRSAARAAQKECLGSATALHCVRACPDLELRLRLEQSSVSITSSGRWCRRWFQRDRTSSRGVVGSMDRFAPLFPAPFLASTKLKRARPFLPRVGLSD